MTGLFCSDLVLVLRRCVVGGPRLPETVVVAEMYIPCPLCGTVRTLRVRLTPSGIGGAQQSRCLPCANRLRPALMMTPELLVAEIEWLGCSPELAAKHLGTTVAAIAKRLYRAGLPEQARPFERVAREHRRKRKAVA